MANTLILYDGRHSSAERVANAIGYIIGNVRIAEIGDSPDDIAVYDGFCFIFNFYGALTAGKTKSYLLKNREGLRGKRVAFVGLGFSDSGYTKYVVDMETAVGGDLSITGMFIKDERTTSEVGYQIAKKLRAPVSVMPADMLSREVEGFISRHTTLALATGGGARIRCTPLEYLYLDGVFYIISEGGLKFSNIQDNSNVSVSIFDEYTDSTQPLSGLQMYGVAEQVAFGSSEYWQILNLRGVTPEVLEDLPVTLFVLRIVPMTYEYLNSTFANAGYDARQVLDTRFRAERWEISYASLHAAAMREQEKKEAEEAQSKITPRRAAIVTEKAVQKELAQEIRNVLDESAPRKTAEDEEREYQEMSAFIDARENSVSKDEKPVETEEDLGAAVRRMLQMEYTEDVAAESGAEIEETAIPEEEIDADTEEVVISKAAGAVEEAAEEVEADAGDKSEEGAAETEEAELPEEEFPEEESYAAPEEEELPEEESDTASEEELPEEESYAASEEEELPEEESDTASEEELPEEEADTAAEEEELPEEETDADAEEEELSEEESDIGAEEEELPEEETDEGVEEEELPEEEEEEEEIRL